MVVANVKFYLWFVWYQVILIRVMVRYRNRYLILEVILDPEKDFATDDSIIITQYNISKAIKDSILLNFGECGFASTLGSFQGR